MFTILRIFKNAFVKDQLFSFMFAFNKFYHIWKIFVLSFIFVSNMHCWPCWHVWPNTPHFRWVLIGQGNMILLVGFYQKTWGLNAGRSFPSLPRTQPLRTLTSRLILIPDVELKLAVKMLSYCKPNEYLLIDLNKSTLNIHPPRNIDIRK